MHQRTRHASLDFPRSNHRLSPQEEWAEFLSTSMAALTTEDDDDQHDVGSRSLSSLHGLDMRHSMEPAPPRSRNAPSDPAKAFAVSAATKPQRRDSFSESLTSSTGSSPAATATWRPLGRRASAHIVSSSNQLEHHLELGFDRSPFAQPPSGSNNNGIAKTLPHTSSFRDVAQVSSSSGSSSQVESSSDEEVVESVDNNAFDREALRPARIDVPQNYATSPLPSLSPFQDDARQPVLVKSPVLGSRKDSQTWQLQDEELITSPRFGQFRSSLDESAASMFGGGMGIFAEETNNNQATEARETRTRTTKDTRASSVDFTFVRPTELNPPLPPQEPQLQRLRARSFSYSAGFGSNNYNPAYVNKTYVPQHQSQPDFPVTMRQFHAGAPAPPQPTTMGSIRPPRVTIPANEAHAYHQHQLQHQVQHQVQQQAPPSQPYRRYSSDFVAPPPYPDQMPQHEPDVPMHRSHSGRGIRSFSMEYFQQQQQQSNQRVRTQSLEGNQMFAPAAPPAEYPAVNRHASGGVSYEWPRSPIGAPLAPPLPPDVRLGSSNQYPLPPPEAYYEVEFKRGRTEYFAGNAGFNAGEYVKVEADRGEDIGRVLRRVTDLSKITGGSSVDPSGHGEDPLGRSKRHELPTKRIINVANARECDMLCEQRKEEHEVFEVCKSKVRQRLLPMNVIDAEYQFDRHKLTFFFEADRRIDFRELVRDLFAIYKTRIWLQQVVPSGKKSMNELELN